MTCLTLQFIFIVILFFITIVLGLGRVYVFKNEDSNCSRFIILEQRFSMLCEIGDQDMDNGAQTLFWTVTMMATLTNFQEAKNLYCCASFSFLINLDIFFAIPFAWLSEFIYHFVQLRMTSQILKFPFQLFSSNYTFALIILLYKSATTMYVPLHKSSEICKLSISIAIVLFFVIMSQGGKSPWFGVVKQ